MPGVDILATAMTGANAAFLADLYARWVEKPDSVDPSFQELFAALNDDARAYIAKRSLSESTVAEFMLGYAQAAF